MFQKAAGFDLPQAAAERSSRAPHAQLQISVFVLCRKKIQVSVRSWDYPGGKSLPGAGGLFRPAETEQDLGVNCPPRLQFLTVRESSPYNPSLLLPRSVCCPLWRGLWSFEVPVGRFSWRKAFYSSSSEAVWQLSGNTRLLITSTNPPDTAGAALHGAGQDLLIQQEVAGRAEGTWWVFWKEGKAQRCRSCCWELLVWSVMWGA